MRMEVLWRVMTKALVMTMDTTIIKSKTQEEINMKISVNLARAMTGMTSTIVITTDRTIIKNTTFKSVMGDVIVSILWDIMAPIHVRVMGLMRLMMW